MQLFLGSADFLFFTLLPLKNRKNIVQSLAKIEISFSSSILARNHQLQITWANFIELLKH